MTRGVRLAGAALFLGLGISAAAAQPPAEDAIRAGQRARAAGDFAGAETAFASALQSRPGDAETLNLLALVQAYQQHYTDALATIAKARAAAPQDLDIVLTEARIFAWVNRYADANTNIDRVLAARPNDAEALALRGRVALYQNQPDRARGAFEAALRSDPKSLDAALGLGDVARARGDERAAETYYLKGKAIDPTSRDVAERLARKGDDTTPKWRADVSATHSYLSRTAQADWSEQSFRLERKISAVATLYGGIFRAHRFGKNDIEIAAGGATPLGGGVSAELMAGVTPDDDFLPAWRLAPSLAARIGETTSVLLEGNLRHYGTGSVKGVNVGLDQYLFEGKLNVVGRFINSFDPAGKHLTGWSVSATVAPVDQFRIRGGYADAPESDSGIVAGTRSWFVGAAYDISPTVTLRIDFLREDRERAYLRKELTGGLAIRF